MNELNNRINFVYNLIRPKSNAALAKELHVSPQYIGKLLRGEQEPSDRFLKALADRASVSFDWLKTGAGTVRENVDIEVLGYSEITDLDFGVLVAVRIGNEIKFIKRSSVERTLLNIPPGTFDQWLQHKRLRDSGAMLAAESCSPYDDITSRIVALLADMPEEKKRDLLRHVEKEKLLEDLLKERRERTA